MVALAATAAMILVVSARSAFLAATVTSALNFVRQHLAQTAAPAGTWMAVTIRALALPDLLVNNVTLMSTNANPIPAQMGQSVLTASMILNAIAHKAPGARLAMFTLFLNILLRINHQIQTR